MAQFTLPKNSRMTEGKAWPKPAGASRLQEFRIYRWNPDDGANPRIDTYHVDRDDCGPMVLEALLWIKNKVDPTLPLRHEYHGHEHAGLHARDRRLQRRRDQDLPASPHAGHQGSGARPDEILCA